MFKYKLFLKSLQNEHEHIKCFSSSITFVSQNSHRWFSSAVLAWLVYQPVLICKGRIPHLNLAKTERWCFCIGFNRYGSTLNSFLNVTLCSKFSLFPYIWMPWFNIHIFNSALNYFKITLKFRNKFIFKSISIHYSPDLWRPVRISSQKIIIAFKHCVC